jgi:hypothetical protein
MSIGAIIMLGSGATSEVEQLVLEAQRAATLDLVELLQRHLSAQLILSSPDLKWFPKDVDAILEVDPTDQPFHFGTRLADLVEQHQVERLLYFGGGSAPLLDHQIMSMIGDLIVHAGSLASGPRIPSHIVLANNRHSSDWVCISHVADAIPVIRRTDRDNSLAWALQETGEFEVRILAGIRPATSMDLDTPADLAIVRLHPDCPAHLASALQVPLLDGIPIRQVVDVFRREGANVTLIGRVSPLAWQAINKVTRCWTRVFAEERGMVASERINRGEVRSLLGELLRVKGAYGFFQTLASMSDAAIIDSRVLMADQLKEQPSQKDRFTSDLFMPEDIQDPWLKEFTQAAKEAPIPVVLGGHNVVSGGLYALAEIIDGRSGRAIATSA